MDVLIGSPTQTANLTQVQGIKFWPRAGAYFIDILLLNGLIYVVSHSCIFILRQLLSIVAPIFGKYDYYSVPIPTIGIYIISFVQTILYFALFEWLFGRTFGKLAWGLRVISSNGDSCNFKQAFSRSVYRIIDGLFFGIVAASFMKPPTYQRLGDQKALTLVVSSKDVYIKEKKEAWKFLLALFLYLVSDGLILITWYSLFLRFE